MEQSSQPFGLSLSEGLGPLVACPLCGESKGYTLHEGTSYRWWRVCCGHCGADVDECRSDGGTSLGRPKPERWPAADHAWNEAGKHAHELRCALYEADMLAGHDDAFTEWREKWAHLWALRA